MKSKMALLVVMVLLGLLVGCGPQGEPTRAPPSLPTATATPTIPPTPEGPQAIVIDVINQVDAHPFPEGAWEKALENMTVYLGGEVWAKEASTARVGIEKDLLRVAPNTIFTFRQSDANTMQLNLQEGQIWVNVEGLGPGESFNVETPAAVASVRGTRLSVRVAADGTTVVSVQEGQAEVVAAGQSVTVTAGHETRGTPGQPPDIPMSMGLTEQVYWGMAANEDLDAVMPAYGTLASYTASGVFSLPSWSHDGNLFAFRVSDPSVKDGERVISFYDLVAHTLITVGLPTQTYALFFSPAEPALALVSYVPGEAKICTYAGEVYDGLVLDEEQLTCIGGDGSHYGWPYWSPDGEWILFYADLPTAPGLALNLFKVRPDGSELTRLTSVEELAAHRQSWSPDSKWIAYVLSEEYAGDGDLWIVGVDGSPPQKVFAGVQGGTSARVAWSPDGQWLAVPATSGGLWLVHPDGSEAHQLPGTEAGAYHEMVWSPTETGWPLFFYFEAGSGEALYYLAADGTAPMRLATPTWGPFWSPDGSRVAFDLQHGVDPAQQEYRSEWLLLPVFQGFWQ